MADIESILRSASIPQSVKAQAWDLYHSSANEDDFASKVQKLAMPNSVKADLWDLKRAETVQPAPTETPTVLAPSSTDNMDILKSTESQMMLGAQPAELLERVKGMGRTIAKTGLGAVQYAQYLAGRPVSPIPPSLEPTGDPNEDIGRKVGQIALTSVVPGAPAKLGRTAALAVNTAIGSATGGVTGAAESPEAGTVGAVVGGAIPVVGQAVSDLSKYAGEKEWAAKLWNQVAKVKAGRGGTQLNMQTGEFKTLPGRAMVRASEEQGPLSQTLEAFLAKPNDAARTAAYREMSQAGADLTGKLAQSPQRIDISALTAIDSKKAIEAMSAAGLPPTKLIKGVRPDVAHKLTQELGDRINWNPDVVNEANDQLKDAWFAIRDQVNSAAVGVKADYKRWQEAYLFTKALKGTMEKAANSPLGKLTAGKVIKGAAVTGVAEELIRRSVR